MKNKILLILMCCVTLLSGCGKNEDKSVQGGNTSDSVVKSTRETNLQHVTRSGGGVSVCSSKIGTYYQSNNNGVIGYYDEKSKLSTALYNRPECAHQDKTCTAFVESSVYTLCMNPQEDKLFVLYVKDVMNDSGEFLVYIDVMDTNGENRKMIYELLEGQADLEIAFGEESIYFTTSKFDEQNKQYGYSLVKLNYNTGKSEIVENFDKRMRIVSAFDNYLVFEYDNGSLSGASNDIYTFDINTKELVLKHHYDSNGYEAVSTAFAEKESLYIFETNGEKSAKLDKLDMRTGERTPISEKVTYFGFHTNFLNGLDSFDNYLIMTSSTPPINGGMWPHSETYAINIETGEETYIGLKSEAEEYLFIDDMTDSLVVYTGIKETKLSRIDVDGTKRYMTAFMPQYSIMSKSDYLSSIKNFIELR